MLTDELFALKAETLPYFDLPAALAGGALARRLAQLAVGECLHAARIASALGGQRHTREVLELGSAIRALARSAPTVARAAFLANRDLTIALAEQQLGTRRSRVLSPSDARRLAQLFQDVVNANHAALDRLRRAGAPAPARRPG